LHSHSSQSLRKLGCTTLQALALLSVIVFPGQCIAQEATTNEYQLKAAYLFNFAKFVEWPTNTFSDADTPLQICVIGLNPFGHGLEDSIAGKTVGGRPIEISHKSDAVEARSCQIVFIGVSDKRQIPQLLRQLNGASVLTVGDTSGFTDDGGMINFVLEGDRVRFEANLDAAEHAHLKISARLLSVAKAVMGKSQDERH
jgi:YfiR/HmsC-like